MKQLSVIVVHLLVQLTWSSIYICWDCGAVDVANSDNVLSSSDEIQDRFYAHVVRQSHSQRQEETDRQSATDYLSQKSNNNDLNFSSNRKEVFIFSTSSKNWRQYDWSKITTIVEFGYHDDELTAYAHSKNITVSYSKSFDRKIFTDKSQRREWISQQVAYISDHHLDGINIDFEDEINATDIAGRDGFTAVMRELKAALPKSQVTIDFAFSPDCIDNRCFDHKGLADAVDFVFIMSYDERGQIRGPCVAWANSPMNITLKGLQDFMDLGIPANKIVLGVPWYGYKYECINYTKQGEVCHIKLVPFRGCPCSDAAGSEIGYSDLMDMYATTTTGRLWDPVAMSPYFTYKDPKTGALHQMWYDDPGSLKLKYKLAKQIDLLGVGMWEADSLDYTTDTPVKRKYIRQMWAALP